MHIGTQSALGFSSGPLLRSHQRTESGGKSVRLSELQTEANFSLGSVVLWYKSSIVCKA